MAEPVDQLPGGDHALPFARHDRDIVALGELDLAEEGVKALFLDVKDGLIAIHWSARRQPSLERKSRFGILRLVNVRQVFVDTDSADRHFAACVRLPEHAARVPGYFPALRLWTLEV